jgi:hypothetical protein
VVDNSNIPFKSVLSPIATCEVCRQTHLSELYVAKKKIQNLFDSIEHRSTEQVLADPLTKGLPPSVLREHIVDMGLWWNL